MWGGYDNHHRARAHVALDHPQLGSVFLVQRLLWRWAEAALSVEARAAPSLRITQTPPFGFSVVDRVGGRLAAGCQFERNR